MKKLLPIVFILCMAVIACNNSEQENPINNEEKNDSLYTLNISNPFVCDILQCKSYSLVHKKSLFENTYLNGVYYRVSDTLFYVPAPKNFMPFRKSSIIKYPLCDLHNTDSVCSFSASYVNINGSISHTKKYFCKVIDLTYTENKHLAVNDTIVVFTSYVKVIDHSENSSPSINIKYQDPSWGNFKAVFVYSTQKGITHFDYLNYGEPILPYLPFIKL